MGGRRCGRLGGLGIRRDLLTTLRGLDRDQVGARIRNGRIERAALLRRLILGLQNSSMKSGSPQ